MNTTRKKVLLRADGSSEIGLGHVARCCALAEMLKDNFDCYFCIRKTSKEVIEDIKKYCVAVFELGDNISYEEEALQWSKKLNKEEIVVLDGYNFNTQYQSQIKSQGCKLVCIDDIYAYHFVCDVLINHAGGARIEDYSTEAYTKVFVGLKYALLRNEFLEASKSLDKNPKDSNILVCLGGADPQNHTLQILKTVLQLNRGNINVVVGSAYKYIFDLKDLSAKNSSINLCQNINATEMVEIMRRCSIAICTPSTVAFEYLSIVNGLLFLKLTADNQKKFFDFLITSSMGFPFEYFIQNKKCSPNYALQNNYFDGLQAERYHEIFNLLAA